MPRRRDFSVVETDLIRDNYDSTVIELQKLLDKSGYKRSCKSISRKIEKMRKDGELGDLKKSPETIKRAYKQRKDKKVPSTGPSFRDGPSLRDGDSWGDDSWGKATWDDE